MATDVDPNTVAAQAAAERASAGVGGGAGSPNAASDLQTSPGDSAAAASGEHGAAAIQRAQAHALVAAVAPVWLLVFDAVSTAVRTLQGAGATPAPAARAPTPPPAELRANLEEFKAAAPGVFTEALAAVAKLLQASQQGQLPGGAPAAVAAADGGQADGEAGINDAAAPDSGISTTTSSSSGSSGGAASAPGGGSCDVFSLTCAASGRDVRLCRCEHHDPAKLVAGGGCGSGGGGGAPAAGGGGGGGGGSNISSNSQQQWWLLRYEAESGAVVNAAHDADAGVAAGPAAWADPRRQQALESTHLSWLNASLCCWALMAPGSGFQPPPLALVLRLAARAAEALARLSSGGSSGGDPGSVTTTCGDGGGGAAAGLGGPGGPGLGLGGATYGPAPTFMCAYMAYEGFVFAGRLKALLQPPGGGSASSSSNNKAARTQVNALLPEALEAGCRFLAIQVAALRQLQPAGLAALVDAAWAQCSGAEAAAEAKMDADWIALQTQGTLSPARALEETWNAVAVVLEDLGSCLSARSEGAALMHGASPQCRAAVAAVARRTGLLRSLGALLRAATSAELALLRARPAAGEGATGGGSSSDTISNSSSSNSNAAAVVGTGASGGTPGDQGRRSIHDSLHGAVRWLWVVAGALREALLEDSAAAAAGSRAASSTSTSAGTSNRAGSSNSSSSSGSGSSEELGLVVSGMKRGSALLRYLVDEVWPPPHVERAAEAAEAAEADAAAAGASSANSMWTRSRSGGVRHRCACRLCRGRKRMDFQLVERLVRDLCDPLAHHARCCRDQQPFWLAHDAATAVEGAQQQQQQQQQQRAAGGTTAIAAAAAWRAAQAAAEVHVHVLHAACEFGQVAGCLPSAFFVIIIGAHVEVTATALDLWAAAAAASATGPWPGTPTAAAAAPEAGAAAPPLAAAQLLACQPHRLLAAACGMLARMPAEYEGDPADRQLPDARFALVRALVRALAAAGSHPQLAPHLLSWLAPEKPQQPQQELPLVQQPSGGLAGAATASAAAAAAAAAPAELLQPDPLLRGHLRTLLKMALPAALNTSAGTRTSQPPANRAHAAAVAALMDLAVCWAHASGGGGGGGAGGGSVPRAVAALSAAARRLPATEWLARFGAFAVELQRIAALDSRPSCVRDDREAEPVAAVAAALSAMRLPISGATVASVLSAYVGAAGDAARAKKAAVAEKVRQRRAQQLDLQIRQREQQLLQQREKQKGRKEEGEGVPEDQGQLNEGAAAPPAIQIKLPENYELLPPPLPVDPLATAFWRLRVCGNPGCEEFGGASEAELDLRLCGRCRSVRYCCAGCQAAHWAAGHREACGRVARACAASAGGH
ncbi:hypothetical protein HYH02_003755 [Chlamydomonas schloesseri]|uniref:phytol kinase n=1 Tax=Chlamydomonas schloesseri TaxID=2026947 RepID=A0A835WRA5_9CHLO|nr:hypothetical protein HYH02_003755 [Chlamydomonas schloesseri]|eukprot:KAG2451984.1 hypothetical protein HYH02_003755 [Chlamydomonas schloesseri]